MIPYLSFNLLYKVIFSPVYSQHLLLNRNIFLISIFINHLQCCFHCGFHTFQCCLSISNSLYPQHNDLFISTYEFMANNYFYFILCVVFFVLTTLCRSFFCCYFSSITLFFLLVDYCCSNIINYFNDSVPVILCSI